MLYYTSMEKRMNFKHFILMSALAITILPANAYLVTEESTSPEYLINNNYSTQTADLVQLEIAKNHNREYKSGRYEKKTVWKKIWSYFDPGYDDGTLLQHDIKPGSSFFDW